MNFVVKKRKPPVVPIVSLIDILAILLIFFIATSTFKKPKLGVDIEPPSTANLDTRPMDDRRRTVSISEKNEIFFGAEERALESAGLAARLAAAHAATEKVELKADEKAHFGVIVKVLDALEKAGYKRGDYPTILQTEKPRHPAAAGTDPGPKEATTPQR